MCGRFALGVDFTKLKQHVGFTNHIVYRPRFNVAPSEMALVLKDPGYLEFMCWGFTPGWYQGKPLTNARSETIEEKPTFARAYKKNRCVVLASGYYEWAKVRGEKQPYYIYAKSSEILFLAGIYVDNTFAVITTSAVDKISKIHNRMPLLVSKEKVNTWLNGKALKDNDCFANDSILLGFHKVSKRVNYPGYDHLECIETLDF